MKKLLSMLFLFGVLFAFTAKIHADGTYLVIDLETWQYRYTDTAPNLADDTCRTTELWLRYIPAGEFMMGSPADELGRRKQEVQHKVTLTKPFYIGVFECTQAQWEYVMGEGNRPSYFNNDAYYATRPVEKVSYYMIRGMSAGAGWPDSTEVDPTSFMGVLRDKTGLAFDLPTEAQWEYACRAGTKTALNSGKNLENTAEDANMAEVGRYWYNGGEEGWVNSNCDTTGGTAKVGSYKKNNWGLYDMHGNVMEWCLDLYGGSYSPADATDPKGNATGQDYMIRDGCWMYDASVCRSASREFEFPNMNLEIFGFRILCLSMPPETYAVTVVKGTADKTEAAEGETVTITADEPPSGKVFDSWTGNVEFVNATATETTFVMPPHAVTVTANYYKKGTRYLVIYDLDKDDKQYRYTDDDPDLDNDTCRTTELWLRYIPAGTFMMGSPVDELESYSNETQHKVTLTKPFYIGVFECTQRQWELVMGGRPSYFYNNDCYDTRPVELVSYNMIRGAGWPENGHAVDATSFMGVLRDKTGLTFDLPTEAQWEYACRAGTITALNSNKNLEDSYEDANMAEVGRYFFNGTIYTSVEGWTDPSQDCGTEYGTAKVGSYKPNAWGLYDMHGNVYEWCLDWYGGSYSPADATDPVGAATSPYYEHLLRSGGWYSRANNCRSATRISRGYDDYSSHNDVGFRVVFLPPEAYAVTVVKGTADKTEAAEGETVTITANMPSSGQTFDKWTGRGVTFANATAATTTFEMPAKAVTVTATFKKIPAVKTYKIVVVNGTADKAKAAAGETVTLTANPPPAGKVFDKWTGGAVFDDPTSPATTFTMPAKAVTPKALYKRK